MHWIDIPKWFENNVRLKITKSFDKVSSLGMLKQLWEILGTDQAPRVPPGTEPGLVIGPDIGGQLVLGLDGGGVDLGQVVGEEVVDFPLVLVQLLGRLLEHVADQELGAVGGVGLVHRFEKAAEVFGLDSAFSVERKRPYHKLLLA